jgi:hypothetical protein
MSFWIDPSLIGGTIFLIFFALMNKAHAGYQTHYFIRGR